MDLTVLLINIPENTNESLVRTLLQAPLHLLKESSRHLSLEQMALEPTLLSRAYKIAVIRNPYERLVAYYQHLIQKAQQRIFWRQKLAPEGDLDQVTDEQIKKLFLEEVYQDPACLEFLGPHKITKLINHLRHYQDNDPIVVTHLKQLGFSNWLQQVLNRVPFPKAIQPQMKLAYQFVTTSQESYLQWHGRQKVNALFRYEQLAEEFELLTDHLQIPSLNPVDYPTLEYQSHYTGEALAQVTPYLQPDLDVFRYRFGE